MPKGKKSVNFTPDLRWDDEDEPPFRPQRSSSRGRRHQGPTGPTSWRQVCEEEIQESALQLCNNINRVQSRADDVLQVGPHLRNSC